LPRGQDQAPPNERLHGTPGSTGRIIGPGVDFAQVVTQTCNFADTGLHVKRPMTTAWMVTAQCFVGVSSVPGKRHPESGTRNQARDFGNPGYSPKFWAFMARSRRP